MVYRVSLRTSRRISAVASLCEALIDVDTTARCAAYRATAPERLAGDGVTTADAGEHFPKRVQNPGDSSGNRRGVFVSYVFGKHLALGGGMFPVSFDVDTEVFVIARCGEIIVLDQTFDFRFRDGGNLTLVSVESGEAFSRFAFGANRTEGRNQIVGLIPLFSRLSVVLRNAETFGELEPELRVVWRAGFFVDEIIEELAAGRLVVAIRVHGREIGRERSDVVAILARVIGERGPAQFAPPPPQIERMRE